MYHRVRRKMYWHFTFIAILINISLTCGKSIENEVNKKHDEDFDNNIIDFDSAYDVKYDKKYGMMPWHSNDKDTHKYTLVKEDALHKIKEQNRNKTESKVDTEMKPTTETSFIPIELISTTQSVPVSVFDSTSEPDLTVIPLNTTEKISQGIIEIESVTLPTSTQYTDISTYGEPFELTTTENTNAKDNTTTKLPAISTRATTQESVDNTTADQRTKDDLKANATNTTEIVNRSDNDSAEVDVPIFTELDIEDEPAEVPEDYYDSKDVLPTKAPNNDALSVIFGLAGSMVESMAERVMPKGIMDLFKRMQKQNEELEAERLRSREENGGIGQFGRGLLKSISTGLSKPFSQLMAVGARDKGSVDKGSLDSDRGFVGSVAAGVTSVANVANSLVDAFKNRVQAIYPGTVWCGDGRSAQARSSDLGLFFFTDTCCRQHDACKLYIRAGETKYGLTNTGLFTRSHCSCDMKFRQCLQKTSSLVSAQIGLTYFNVLGPQCFRKAHPIVRCMRRTRITGQKCEEYELDYTKPKMWQWFDNETY